MDILGQQVLAITQTIEKMTQEEATHILHTLM